MGTVRVKNSKTQKYGLQFFQLCKKLKTLGSLDTSLKEKIRINWLYKALQYLRLNWGIYQSDWVGNF